MLLYPPHPPKQAQRLVVATSLPAALCLPVVGQTPAGEVRSSVARASFPEDSLIASVVSKPPPTLAQAGPIAGETCCLLLLSNFVISAVVISRKKGGLMRRMHLESRHVL